MFALPLLLLLPFTEAFVRLQNSILYDEVDFKGVDQITTDMCAAGCKFYATIPTTDENKRITQNIIISNPNTKKEISVADLSRLFMEGSHEKAFLEIGNAASVTISNKNANQESAPLALWVVSTKSPYYLTAEVFEPMNLNRAKSVAPAPITILSAYPFTIQVQPGNKNAVLARAAGYDAIDRNSADNCYAAMENDFDVKFEGFFLAINGPLLTLSFNTAKFPHAEIELSGGNGIGFDLFPKFPAVPTFISSTGFVCGSAANQVYRSSALSPGSAFTIHTPQDEEMMFNFDINMNTDGAHPVSIYDHKTALSYPFSGTFKDGTNAKHNVQLQTYRTTISFDSGAGGLFGMRIWGDEVREEDKKTTTSGSASTTRSTSDMTTSLANSHSIIVLILVVVSVILV